MISLTHRRTIASAKRQIASSSKAIYDSKKRIYNGSTLVDNSKTSITNSRYRFILSITFLTTHFLVTTFQELENFIDFEFIQVHHKNTQIQPFLTPQENLHQIRTHPFKTGLCPYCSHSFPKLKEIYISWNCLACGWSDSLFN